MIRSIGQSEEGIELFSADSPSCLAGCILSVGFRFRCGGTDNEWEVISIDAQRETVQVVRTANGNEDFDRLYPLGDGPFTWHYRSVLCELVPLTHRALTA
jgi:hypothetical protein